MPSGDMDPWLRAAFLPELTEALEGGPEPVPEQSRETAERWRRDGLLEEDLWAARLRSEGLDRDLFARILSLRRTGGDEWPWTPPPAGAPSWQRTLWRIFAGEGRRDRELVEEQEAEPRPPFLPALAPFLSHAWELLRDSVPPAPNVRCEWATLRRGLLRPLALRLSSACRRVLALELNIARLEERLQGPTGEARYLHFCTLLLEGGWRTVLREYQPLARSMATVLEQAVESASELLGRLAADWEVLRATWRIDAPRVSLVEAEGGLSDPHRAGRTVWLLGLEPDSSAPGQRLRLVYKPRPMAAERQFQELLQWVNQRADPVLPPFRTLRILAREGYGWSEFVELRECDSREAASRFYVRQGGLIALSHLVGAIDLHEGNLLACGEHPVLVDLEALFHRDLDEPDDGSARSVARRKLATSVLRTDLLPRWLTDEVPHEKVSVSALGEGLPRNTPVPVPVWDGAGTDDLREVRRLTPMPMPRSVPRLAGAAVPASEHIEDIASGFQALYRLLERERSHLLAPDGPLSAFAEVETRQLLHPTAFYAQLLHEGTHPDNQRDALDRERLLDVLWLMSRTKPRLQRAIASEKADLRRGDVPLFITRPSSRHLWDAHGRCLPDVFASDGLEEARQRLAGLSSGDLSWQTSVLRASLATLIPAQAQEAPEAGPPPPLRRVGPGSAPGLLTQELVEAARELGGILVDLAITGRRGVTWIGLSAADAEHWKLGPTGGDLYDGTSGIALFLGYLGHVTGEERFSRCAQGFVDEVCEARRRGERSRAAPGGFCGSASRIYAFTHLACLWNEPDLLHEAWAEPGELRAAIGTNAVHDVTTGTAGTAAALLAVHQSTRLPGALELALDHAHALCERLEGDITRAWALECYPLLGFAHGAGGIAWALLSLADAVRDRPEHAGRVRAFHQLAHAAIDYERRWFDPERRNWPDLRFIARGQEVVKPHFMTAWCHGAPGVALARVLALPSLDGEEVREEIATAVETTLEHGLRMKSHGLCHGDLGNLMVVSRASEALGREDWRDRVQGHLAQVLEELRTTGPRLGLPREMLPGLMNGLAGVGYGLLYQAAPERVPLVLGLQPVVPHLRFPRNDYRKFGETPQALAGPMDYRFDKTV